MPRRTRQAWLTAIQALDVALGYVFDAPGWTNLRKLRMYSLMLVAGHMRRRLIAERAKRAVR